ncbi:MAG: LPS assembly protein LptD [Sneathiella sp.]|uniref:LPS-assembly protein LptD n=1 Tax=Sneathiella sp. TaxID=1964365 RepID=UPI0030019768
MKSLARLFLTTTFLCTAFVPHFVSAEKSPELDFAKESLFSAKEITYDKEGQKVEATGDVEVVQGDRVLKADKIIYNIPADTIKAKGNVVLLEPTGDVVFADEMELQNELKTGAIRDIRILFSDQSRLAAHEAIKIDENRTVMTKAVFSTCRLCEEDPERPVLWQVKAEKVEHDRAEQSVTYRNAVFEFFGVPVMYTPYFSHPDPTVDRESGFLSPKVYDSSTLGYGIKLPYYIVISEDKDMTITPNITTKEGVQLAAEYRQAVSNGDFEFDGSTTYVDERNDQNQTTGGHEFQSHIRGDGQFQIDDTWLWGFDVFRTSHDTYLDKYDISDEDTLTSKAYIQGQRGRNFSVLSAYSFQGLTEADVSSETPFVPAWWDYSYVGEPNDFGGRASVNMDTLLIYREDSQDTNRLSLSGGYHIPYTTANGQVLSFDTSLRGDMYYARNILSDPSDPSTGTGEDAFTARAVPSISMEWKYPFVRQAGSVRQVVEPIVEGVWSDILGDEDTPNEDSLSFEFDDTNLFGSNRFAGLDVVEEGARLNYGINMGVYGESGGYTTLLIGQSIHSDKDTSFPDGTGLEDQFSDFVTRLEIRPTSYLQFINRTRINHDKLSLARNEIDLKVGTSKNFFDLGYVYLRDDPNGLTQDTREEIYVAGKVEIAEFWSAYGDYRRNLAGTGNSVDGRIGIEYLDECFGFSLELKKSFTRDRDLEPDTTIGFNIRLLPFN